MFTRTRLARCLLVLCHAPPQVRPSRTVLQPSPSMATSVSTSSLRGGPDQSFRALSKKTSLSSITRPRRPSPLLKPLQGERLVEVNAKVRKVVQVADNLRHICDPLVGICLDTANSLGRPETLETVVEHLAEHTVMLHARDYDIRRIDTRMGFSAMGRPAGEGRVDFDWVLNELQKRGREGISVIVEHWPPFEGTIEKTVEAEQEWLTRSVPLPPLHVSGPTEETG
jgi:hypothetical protein